MIPHTILFAAAAKLGRRMKLNQQGEVIWLDELQAPTTEVWQAAIDAVKSRKTIKAAAFAELFTTDEKHAILRRGTLTAGTSPVAPLFAKLNFRFAQLTTVHSDAQELTDVLDLLEQTGVINNARRQRIAAFLPPEE